MGWLSGQQRTQRQLGEEGCGEGRRKMSVRGLKSEDSWGNHPCGGGGWSEIVDGEWATGHGESPVP